MKNIFIIFLYLLATIVYSEDLIKYEEITRDVLSEIVKVISESENEQLKDMIKLPLNKHQNGELIFNIVKSIDDENNLIIGTAAFNFNKINTDELEYIKIEERLFKLYPSNKSLFMAIIIHELYHAYCYYSYKDAFISSTNNDLEKYLYEMDAVYIEALFIEECKKQGYKLTPFETIMLKSLHEDNLNIFSILFLRADNGITWHLISLRDEYVSGKTDINILLGRIYEVGTSAKENWENNRNNETNNWNKYSSLVRMKTYEKFLSKIINKVITDKIAEENKKEIDNLNSIREDMYLTYTNNLDWIEEYRNKIIASFFKEY